MTRSLRMKHNSVALDPQECWLRMLRKFWGVNVVISFWCVPQRNMKNQVVEASRLQVPCEKSQVDWENFGGLTTIFFKESVGVRYSIWTSCFKGLSLLRKFNVRSSRVRGKYPRFYSETWCFLIPNRPCNIYRVKEIHRICYRESFNIFLQQCSLSKQRGEGLGCQVGNWRMCFFFVEKTIPLPSITHTKR